ncbi:MAG: hypothetical protein H0W56_00310 [Acidothermales bacterium]|jgi:hypothetical protein|nr:hypothetical protein [Acidothermales bacterium]
MSELDLGLKVASRRLLWRMGFATRVNVPLRAFVPSGQSSRARYETFTDLDVLGLAVAPGFAVRTVIADCKTSAGRSTERMFWIRGVADFLSADDAWMVRSGGVTAASRQLSSRLRISVLEPSDLERLEEYHPTTLPLIEDGFSFLFEEQAVAKYMKAFGQLDKKLNRLLEYRQFDYWVYDEHRNLVQLVAHLADAAKHLDPDHPVHRALFFELAWLYALSLFRAAVHVRAVHVTDVDTALREYLFGGQVALQEKEQLAAALNRLAPKQLPAPSGAGMLPAWYSLLLELLTRHLRRPQVANAELRYAEWVAEAQLARVSQPVAAIYGSSFDPVAAKLLADVCGFLVTVGRLQPEFRTTARDYLAQPVSDGGEGSKADNQVGGNDADADSPSSDVKESADLSDANRQTAQGQLL